MSTGPRGSSATGPTGYPGQSALLSSTGPIGFTGMVGATGPTGYNFGPRGGTGPMGSTGSTGATGYQGESRSFFHSGTFSSDMVFLDLGTNAINYVLTSGQMTYTVTGETLSFCSSNYNWGPRDPSKTGTIGFTMPFNGRNTVSFTNFGAYSGVTGDPGGIPLVGVLIPTNPPDTSAIVCFTQSAGGMAMPSSQDNIIAGTTGTLNLSVVFNINASI